MVKVHNIDFIVENLCDLRLEKQNVIIYNKII